MNTTNSLKEIPPPIPKDGYKSREREQKTIIIIMIMNALKANFHKLLTLLIISCSSKLLMCSSSPFLGETPVLFSKWTRPGRFFLKLTVKSLGLLPQKTITIWLHDSDPLLMPF